MRYQLLQLNREEIWNPTGEAQLQQRLKVYQMPFVCLSEALPSAKPAFDTTFRD